jgi:hypothetical protein
VSHCGPNALTLEAHAGLRDLLAEVPQRAASVNCPDSLAGGRTLPGCW